MTFHRVLDSSESVLFEPGVDARPIRVIATSKKPRMAVLGNVLSIADCGALIEAATPLLARSAVVNRQTGASDVSADRTSQSASLRSEDHLIASRLSRDVAQLLGADETHFEPWQIAHYQQGQEFLMHNDYFDPPDPGSAATIAASGNRIATLIVYLNTPEAGGRTAFVDFGGLEIAARAGTALFFAYDVPDLSSLTRHAGLPVVRGEKWIATKWLRSQPYKG